MVSAIRSHFPPSVRWQEPQGGLYVWARLPSNLRTGVRSAIFKSALSHDVLYVPGELCYADDATRHKPRNEMRLSFGSASEEDIREGIARLAAVLS
jgi:2-aminoadipate transaminase